MLQDGENHLVWQPGCQGSLKSNAESPDQRQQTILKRITSYRRTSAGDVSGGVVIGGVVGIMASVEKRMMQWQRIEDEARRAADSEMRRGSAPSRRGSGASRRGSMKITFADEGRRRASGGEGEKVKGGAEKVKVFVKIEGEGDEKGEAKKDDTVSKSVAPPVTTASTGREETEC
jgi:hypothetical protein